MKKILTAAAMVICLNGFSQAITNKLNFQPGQKLEVVTDTKKTSNLEVMGQKVETVINSTLTESYDIEKTGPEGTVIEYKIKRLLLNISSPMGGSQTFDSEKEDDRKGELGKLLEKALKNKYTMTVDANGNVTAIKKDDDNPNASKDENEAMAQMISSQLGFSLSVPDSGDASLFKILPDKQVNKNDNWTDSSSANGQKRKTMYKLSAVNDDNIVLDYTEDLDTDAMQEIMGTQAKVKSMDKTTGQIMIDKKTGLLKQRTYTMDSNGTMEGQGMTIPSTGKTTTTITVKSS